MVLKEVLCLALLSSWPRAQGLYRNPHVNPLEVSFSDAFSPRLAEAAMVKQPAALLVDEDETVVYVSSFLNDAVLRAPLPLTTASRFEIFAQGSYCRKDLSMCAILNGPWGLAADREGRIFVASFGSDQVLVFSHEGEFLGALGDSESLDSPEGIAISPDGSTLVVASFLDSRIVAFDLANAPFLATSKSASLGPSGDNIAAGWWTVAEGTPVDLEYMVERVEAQLLRGTSDEQDTYPPSLDLLHGPEDIIFLDGGAGFSAYITAATSPTALEDDRALHAAATDSPAEEQRRRLSGRIAVSSHYNSSILVLDATSGAIEEVLYAAHGALDVPMGLAVDPWDSAGPVEPSILCTSYRSREPGLVARFRDGAYAGVAMSSRFLAGPSALQILSDKSVLVASYDTNSILVFNRTSSVESDAELDLVLRASGSLRQPPNRPAPARKRGRGAKNEQQKRGNRKRHSAR